MTSENKSTNTDFVTYKWLVTTVIASSTGILMLVGALANATFFTKAAGAAVEVKISSTEQQITDMKDMIKEVRQDVKLLVIAQKDK